MLFIWELFNVEQKNFNRYLTKIFVIMKNIINILSFAAVLVFVCNFCYAQQKSNASTAVIKDKEIKLKTKTELANELLQKRQKEKESMEKALPVSDTEYKSEAIQINDSYYPKNDSYYSNYQKNVVIIQKKADQTTAPNAKNDKQNKKKR